MAYEKQTWETGQVITAEKLNHMEDGIGDAGSLMVTLTNENNNPVIDKTTDQITDAINSGKFVFMKMAIQPGVSDGFLPLRQYFYAPDQPVILEFARTDAAASNDSITFLSCMAVTINSETGITIASGTKSF